VSSCVSAAQASGCAQTLGGVRIVSAAELRSHVKFEHLIEPVAAAFREVSAGRADSGQIVMYPVQPRERGDVYVKTGALHGHSAYVVKVSPWFAANVQTGVAQGGFVALFDSHTGHTLAVLNEEHYLSDIRTAAAGAVAARALAPRTIRTASVLGSGVQAYWQCLALHRERTFSTLLIWTRNRDKGAALRQRLLGELPAVEICLELDLEQAVRRAEVLICATASREPIVRGEWLREGQHITAVGADDPSKCELDVHALRRARVFVDSTETTVANGDIYRAIHGGAYSVNDLMGEIGEILNGSKLGRRTEADITIAKLVGIGAQDLVAAEVALAMLQRAAQDSCALAVRTTPT
jgi:ornithine cyclodeaminase/alanine dehydrogenase-like protein (mu-crystallin family)